MSYSRASRMDERVLPARRRMAAPGGDRLPRSRLALVPLRWKPDRARADAGRLGGFRALGCPDRLPFRDRRLDRASADANAGNVGEDGLMNSGSKSFVSTKAGLILISMLSWDARVKGDGGTLRAWKRQGGYEIAVFTEPTPLVTGPVDMSVLLLDGNTGEPI